MRVLVASSELEPFVSSGIMAKRVSNISKAINRDLEIEYIIPLYSVVDESKFEIKPTAKGFEVPVADKMEKAEVWEGIHPDSKCRVWFISNRYFERSGLYGNITGDYPDNAERFVFFSRSILEVANNLSNPDIIHCNDWQTALVPLYLEELYKKNGLMRKTASVLSIYDIRYQGRFWFYDLYILNMGWQIFSPEKLEFYNDINFMKGGIVYSNAIFVTTSGYISKILSPESGCGMEGIIAKYRSKIFPISDNGTPTLDQGPFDQSFSKKMITLYKQVL